MAPTAGRIRVVHVLDNLNTGGTELNAVRTAERLDRDRFDIQFLCLQPEGPLRQRLDAAGIQVRGIHLTSFLGPGALRRVLEIRSIVRGERIDIVHAHDPYANVLAAPAVRLARRGAVIASQRWWRSVHSGRVRAANRLAYRFAHRVLANSPSVGELVVRDEGVPREKLVVIPNFVDDAAFTPLSAQRHADLRRQAGLSPGDVAIGVVANLYPVKDHATLVRAAARLAHRIPNARFVLVGEGSEREAIAAQAAAAGIADLILLPGRMPHEPGLPGIFDVAVLTSIEEGFPNFVVESMAAGRPVVATDVGGVADAVIQGETGILAPAGDDAAIARALEELLSDPGLRARFGAAGSSRARSQYHVGVVMSALTGLYLDLAARAASYARRPE
jgi:glycosyltransferase involved in cell wall biosynthesis